MDKITKILCLLAAGALAACGSGGSSPDAQPSGSGSGNTGGPGSGGTGGSPPPEASESGGYLYGELSLDDGSTYPIQVILSEDGRFRAQQLGPYGAPQTWLLLRGSFELDGRAIDGEGIAIADSAGTWSDGEVTTDLTISGTLDRPTNTDDGKLLVTLSMASGDSGRMEATFAGLSPYYHGSDLERLAGSWLAEQGDNGSWYPDQYASADPPPPPGSVSMIVQADGGFSGTDSDGCVMLGQFSLIDTRYSLWALDYTIRECDREGDYSGLALGDNHWYPTRSLSFTADDGSQSQALEFWQQANE